MTNLEPENLDALVEVVRGQVESGRALCPRGRGTKAHFGPAPRPPADLLSLARVDRIVAHEPSDLVVTVQAGARLADLQETLAEHGQWLPIDPPFENATVGGVLATATSGPRRLGYGSVKDHLIGLRVVGATGVVTRSGGRVVKNVAGYDLHKLHTGAFGSLGVLIEASFKVMPRPECSSALVLASADATAAVRSLLAVWQSRMAPVALEVWQGSEAERLQACMDSLPAAPVLAIVAFEGSRGSVARRIGELGKVLPGADQGLCLEGEHTAALWRAFGRAPERRKVDVVLRVGTRPQDLPAVLDGLGPRLGCAISVGVGVARIVGSSTGGHPESHSHAFPRQGGYLVTESAPLDFPDRERLPWRAATADLGAAIKRAWDPRDLFNPGRVPT